MGALGAALLVSALLSVAGSAAGLEKDSRAGPGPDGASPLFRPLGAPRTVSVPRPWPKPVGPNCLPWHDLQKISPSCSASVDESRPFLHDAHVKQRLCQCASGRARARAISDQRREGGQERVDRTNARGAQDRDNSNARALRNVRRASAVLRWS